MQKFYSVERPYKVYSNINGEVVTYKLPSFHEGNEGCIVELNIEDSTAEGYLYYRIVGGDVWSSVKLVRMNENLISIIPNHKINTKVQYYLKLIVSGKTYFLAHKEPAVVRFQSEVPKLIVFPQEILNFIALIFAFFTGLYAVFKIDTYKKYSLYGFYFFSAATLLGLVICLISFRTIFLKFNSYNDLIFYKEFLIFLFWLIIYYLNKKKGSRYITASLAFLTLIVYCLPQNILFYYLM
jgi:hypothetical protein